MKKIALAVVLAVLLLAPVGGTSGQSVADHPEDASIVGLIVIDEGGHGKFPATGFIVSSDGTVLTNAHVVYRVAQDPAKYRLIALVGREWYGASLVCSTKLPYDPTKTDHDVPFTKDVAVVKLEPPYVDKRWGYPLPGGQRYNYEPHQGPMPEFPVLRLAERSPGVGASVHTTGYSGISALPRLFTTTGSITRTLSGKDGTPLVEMEFTNPTERGASGSPILDASEQVVAINAWGVNVGARGDKAWGISVSELHHPCGSVTL